MKKFIFLSLVLLTACSNPSGYKITNVRLADGTVIKAEVADTAEKQIQGLMFRESLDWDKGMIFPYEDEIVRSFWMKNTLIDLDIIFISDDKIINCVYKHVPKSTLSTKNENVATVACPAMYVLELTAGAAERYKLADGQKVEFKL
ncbi:hypothetical protein Dip510_000969 [Elusimicrobium posterum]|uniref:DUF192 domain-containing protein n=1 Tax=Elusimicrobium posterum TaxID=3116653 RepID=UPI003C707F2D